MRITASSSLAGFVLLTLGMTGPVMARAAPEELSAPNPVDFADVRKKTDALIAEILSDAPAPALRAALAEHAVLGEKTGQVNLVISQYDNLVATYGKAEQCVGLEQSYLSSLRIATSYVCQHRDLLIMWEFETDRLPKGWAYSKIRFSSDF
jgi:hypothetical protein